MMIRRFSVFTALVAVLFAAGCARAADPASPAAPPAAAPTEESGQPSPPVGETISGTVTAGVEPNCTLLSGGGTDYLLIFDDPALRAQVKAGEEVTVVGRAEKGQMTTCQQGTPFIVTSVSPR
jgi:predicted outer membrane protein